jgi:AcrR family transcriptional regulator
MLKFDVGKREHNKVMFKLNIMETFLGSMADKKLNDLNVEEVCKKIGISKVTFFNYFKSKEEVVEYFIQLWQFEMAYEINKQQLKGADVLYFLFDNVSEHPAGHSIILALVSFFIKVECYIPTQVSDYELYIYNEEAYLKGHRSVALLTLIKDAVSEFDISDSEQEVLIKNVISGFYGIPFVFGLGFSGDLKQMYHDFLESLLPR